MKIIKIMKKLIRKMKKKLQKMFYQKKDIIK